MDSQLLLIRAKKIGLKITMARQKMGKTVDEIAQKTGLSSEDLMLIERGNQSPSLPQLQVIFNELQIPVDDLLNSSALEPVPQGIDTSALARFYEIRNRMLGMQLKRGRLQQNLSIENFSQVTEIPVVDLDAYEFGKKPIPVSLFISFCELLHLPYEKVKITEPPIVERTVTPLVSPQAEPEEEPLAEPIIENTLVNNAYSTTQENVKTQPIAEILQYPGLTEELREFINKPINLPFLELALKLSKMDAKKLRDVAESLLEITL